MVNCNIWEDRSQARRLLLDDHEEMSNQSDALESMIEDRLR
ncbi:holliday junction resolvase [Salmonella phage 18-India]|nr:holliday junction resolvase [Salmonella phage 18-India]